MRSPRRFAPRDDISCGLSLQMPCNEAGAVRLARLKGKKMAIKIKNANKKNAPFIVLEKIMHIAENETIMNTSPFFHE